MSGEENTKIKNKIKNPSFKGKQDGDKAF